MHGRGWRIALVLLALAGLPTASAHGDVRGLKETVALEPGAAVAFGAALHWHRLVGTVKAMDASADIEVTVTGPDGTEVRLAGPGANLRANAMVRCCRDATWTEHTFRVRNVGDETSQVAVDLVLLHDDWAVVVDDAEPGAWWQTLGLVLLLAGVPSVMGRRPGSPDPEAARRWLRIGVWSLVAAWSATVVLSTWGMLRFGGGPLQGTRVAVAGVPIYGAFFNSYMPASIAWMALWTLGLAGWAVWARRGQARAKGRGRWLAYAAAAGGPVFTILLWTEYGNGAVAFALGILPAALVVAAVHLPRPSAMPALGPGRS